MPTPPRRSPTRVTGRGSKVYNVMNNVIAARAGGKGQCRPIVTAPAARLCRLARQVERLGVCGRLDPETIVTAKLTLAHELRQLARELGP